MPWHNGLRSALLALILILMLAGSAQANPIYIPPDPPIFKAIKDGNAVQVEAMLAADPALLSLRHPYSRSSLLHFAIGERKKDVVRVLLDRAADMDEVNSSGETLLFHAWEPEIATLLLDRGAKIDARNKNGETPLISEAFVEDFLAVLIKRGANVMATANDGSTALHVAARTRSQLSLKRLLAAGANVNAVTADGATALHVAAANECNECVDLLLGAGAEINARDNSGHTPLWMALHNFSREKRAADVLIRNGAKQ
ncbi:ankyrin repeat domain-containing protein [Paramagnetospirillum kuznetsovii]|nr:ankyrin repeat domain-containing protein [Paramagnetospirillum kuznetsovii]